MNSLLLTPNNTTIEMALSRLDNEISSLIGQRFSAYAETMQVTTREQFADCIDIFFDTFTVAVSECSSNIRSIALRLQKKLTIALMSFYDYIVRGIWILHESPRCREQIADLYYIPESFDLDGLKALIDDVKQSISFECAVEDLQLRNVLKSLRENLTESLQSISNVVDGDILGRGFAVKRWAATFRSNIRDKRSLYKSQWDDKIEYMGNYSAMQEVLTELKSTAMEQLQDNDFYIEDFANTDKLVQSIHSMQNDADGKTLDRFLYYYALVEYLDERLEGYIIKVSATNYTINGDAHIYNNSTVNNNFKKH